MPACSSTSGRPTKRIAVPDFKEEFVSPAMLDRLHALGRISVSLFVMRSRKSWIVHKIYTSIRKIITFVMLWPICQQPGQKHPHRVAPKILATLPPLVGQELPVRFFRGRRYSILINNSRTKSPKIMKDVSELGGGGFMKAGQSTPMGNTKKDGSLVAPSFQHGAEKRRERIYPPS